jgi:signal peptide peptidase SppA
MMQQLRIIFFVILALASISSFRVEAKKSKSTPSDSKAVPKATDPETASFVEENPDYDGDEYDARVDHDEEEKDQGIKASKDAVNDALSSSRKGKFPWKAMAFVKKHRIQITIALAVIAFRKEIGKFLLNKLAPPLVDPETGKVIKRRWLRLDALQILKIIVFIDIMRQLQAAGKSKRDPLMFALILLGAKNPVVSSIITKTLFQENSSYVPPLEQHYTFERLNERYEKDVWALQKATDHHKKKQGGHSDVPPALAMLHHLREAAAQKEMDKKYSETVIVLDLVNINKAPGRIDMLRDEVSFLIHQHQKQAILYSDNEDVENEDLEVLVILESPGGSAADFALASQQLLRLRQQHGIRVTVCVDRVAASGGYMIACASSPGRLFAAPFAVLGSIGVIGQAINVQKLLDGWGVQGMVFKAGKEKAPGGLLGEVSKRDKKSIQSNVDETHIAFQRHVAEARPRLAKTIESVSTGKIWLGYDALAVGLIDRIVTSDEYIQERIEEGARVLKLIKNNRKRSLFGGPPSSLGALDSQILNLKADAKRLLNGLANRINLPIEELDDATSLSSSLAQTKMAAKEEASVFSTSASLF